MKKIKYIIMIMLMLAPVAAFSGLPAKFFSGQRNYVEGEVLVKFKDNADFVSRQNSIASVRGRKLAEYGFTRMVHMKVTDGSSVDDVIEELQEDPNVEYAQPNYIYKAMAVPNDTNFGQQWGARNTGQTVSNPSYTTNNPGTAGKDMNLARTWDLVTDANDVIVAVVDSGVNYNQEDLADNMWDGGASYPNHGYDFVDSDNNPMDLNGHGTHVAGIIGARGNNGKGVAGVCWQTKIMAVRVLDAGGSGSTAGIVSGLQFAVANGAKVVNMSLGGPTFDAAFSSAITAAKNAGVIIIVAAGNDGKNVNVSGNDTYPCNYTQDNIVCVAAVDQNYQLANFSNYGTTSVDVAAPGANIHSTWNGATTTVVDNFNTAGVLNWTTEGTVSDTNDTWGYLFAGERDSLVYPKNFDFTVDYLNYQTDVVYRNIGNAIAGYAAAKVSFNLLLEIEQQYDYLHIGCKSSGGSPFSSGTLLDKLSGSTEGYLYHFSYDVSSLIGSMDSTFGFKFTSDVTNLNNQTKGVVIQDFALELTTITNDQYTTIDGTSMATPEVAGVAALLKQYNPNYTYTDISNALINGGDSVSGLNIKYNKVVDAWGSMKYINTPTNLTLTLGD